MILFAIYIYIIFILQVMETHICILKEPQRGTITLVKGYYVLTMGKF